MAVERNHLCACQWYLTKGERGVNPLIANPLLGEIAAYLNDQLPLITRKSRVPKIVTETEGYQTAFQFFQSVFSTLDGYYPDQETIAAVLPVMHQAMDGLVTPHRNPRYKLGPYRRGIAKALLCMTEFLQERLIPTTEPAL